LNNGGMQIDMGKDLVSIITGYFVPAIAIVAVLWCVWIGSQHAENNFYLTPKHFGEYSLNSFPSP